jgi:DNA polymerase I
VTLALADIPRLVTRLDDVHRIVERVYANPDKAYTYDFETLGLRSRRLKVAGIGVAWGSEPDEGAYVLTAHEEHPHLDWERGVLPILKPMLEDPSLTQVAHNSLFDATILDCFGVELHTNTYDTMVMAFLLNTETPNGLKGLVERRYGYQMTELSDIAEKGVVSWQREKILRLDKVPVQSIRDYAVDDVRWTYRLWRDALEAIKAEPDLDKVYHQLYQEFLLILAQMQSDGIRLEVPFLREREESTRAEVERLVEKLITLRPGQDFDGSVCTEWSAADIDRERKVIPELQAKWSDRAALRPLLYKYPKHAHKVFNPSSGAQLNKVLFDELGLEPVGERGANGQYSVAVDVVSKLLARDETGFVKLLMRYTMLEKLLGTYYVGLQELVDDDGHIRTSYNPTMRTGRLSSSDPNLQNIPSRTDEGKELRKAFVPRGPGWRLLVADFSQIEMRVVAHFSEDPALVEGFKAGADPHSATAKAVFHLPCDVTEVKALYPKERAIAKEVNFGNLYGAGPEKLASQILEATKGEVRFSADEAQAIKEQLFDKMPRVRDWIEYQERLARREGRVFTLLGRPRHLPDAMRFDRKNPKLYHGALRRAVNSPIQGTAADIINLAMRNIRRDFIERGWWRSQFFLALQVHDELVADVHESIATEALQEVKRHMEGVLALEVPIVADPVLSLSWFDAK